MFRPKTHQSSLEYQVYTTLGAAVVFIFEIINFNDIDIPQGIENRIPYIGKSTEILNHHLKTMLHQSQKN